MQKSIFIYFYSLQHLVGCQQFLMNEQGMSGLKGKILYGLSVSEGKLGQNWF